MFDFCFSFLENDGKIENGTKRDPVSGRKTRQWPVKRGNGFCGQYRIQRQYIFGMINELFYGTLRNQSMIIINIKKKQSFSKPSRRTNNWL